MKMIVYKLFRQMKNGSVKSLFINRAVSLPEDQWLQAENHPTKGFKERYGWHCVHYPLAPHLSNKGRVWRQVEIDEYEIIDRPDHQGGRWYLAKQMRIVPISESASLGKGGDYVS